MYVCKPAVLLNKSYYINMGKKKKVPSVPVARQARCGFDSSPPHNSDFSVNAEQPTTIHPHAAQTTPSTQIQDALSKTETSEMFSRGTRSQARASKMLPMGNRSQEGTTIYTVCAKTDLAAHWPHQEAYQCIRQTPITLQAIVSPQVIYLCLYPLKNCLSLPTTRKSTILYLGLLEKGLLPLPT